MAFLGQPTGEDEAVVDPGLGLDPDFAVTVITEVGNYAEIFDRNVGPGHPARPRAGPQRPLERRRAGSAVRPALPLAPHPSMTATTVPVSPARRPPPWRDVRVLRVAAQVAVVAAIVGVVGYLYDNLMTNLRIRGIPTDFDFLDRPATIEIAYSDFRASQPVRDAIAVAVKNTLLVAAVGIPLTTVLGTIVGVARLSTNLLVRSAAGLYVETLRNLPPLLVIVFVNSAVFLELPRIGDPIDVGGFLVLSNRELAAASPVAGDQLGAYALVVAAALVVAVVVWRTAPGRARSPARRTTA